MTTEELHTKTREAAVDLAAELGTMHAVLMTLIMGLRVTNLTAVQKSLIDEALADLKRSQLRFFSEFADFIGGAHPEQN
jgi:hypothetical protein